MKKLGILFICLGLCGCISPEERAAAQYRMRETLKNQCGQTLGFQAGTQDYMNCQMFYDKVMEANHFYISNASFRSSDSLNAYIKNQNETCYYYWGSNNIDKKALWDCVYKIGNEEIEEAKHQKELKEQEELLTRSISAGQKEANDDRRLQERIEAERERVAKETGKHPKNVTCKTYNKSNGYIQVKCK